MSILQNRNNSGDELNKVINQVATLISEQRGALVGKESTSIAIGMESLQGAELDQAQLTFENISTQLDSIGVGELIRSQLGENGDAADVAMEAAVISLMAAGEPAQYHQSSMTPNKGPSSDAVLIDTNAVSIPSMESFTFDAFNNFNAMSVVISALTLAQSSFDELFFPTEVIGGGNSGSEISVSIPYAFNRTKRAANGSPWDFEKKSLVHAIEDHTLLESHATDIYPNAAAGSNNGAFLVDPLVVGNETLVLNGVDITTRPLLFATEVDLLSVSAHPGLIEADTQDETDALESNVGLGMMYIRVTNTAPATPIVGVFKADLAGVPGTLFTRPAEGNTNDLTVNYRGDINLNNNLVSISGVSIDALGIDGLLGGLVTDAWNIDLATIVTGFTNTERANIKVYANSIELSNAYLNGTEVAGTSAEYADLAAAITIELVGYIPKARRVNDNLRMKGIYIDNSETNKYYFPVAIGAPVNSAKPVNSQGGGATVEGLVRALRTRTSNLAVTTLLAAELQIQQMMTSGSPQTNASTIGALFVKPTYYNESLNVQTEITIRTSAGGSDDLRSLIVDKITLMADKMALESSYLSALENFVGADKEYEVIIGTDPRIAGLIMRSGDERTLGFKHTFQVQSSLDLRMRNKIYISFRRKNQSGLDPLSFGCHQTKPALVHEVANSSRGNAVVSEVSVQPIEQHNVLLPILSRLDIVALDAYLSQ